MGKTVRPTDHGPPLASGVPADPWRELLPQPTPTFRRRAWLAFQQALDPLALPRPPRLSRGLRPR